MELVYLVIVLALIEYQVFGMMVARARSKHQVQAPAITGPEAFDRVFRVHQNTLESLIVFIPAILLFARYINATAAAVIGAIFVIARAVYATSYYADAAKRGPGAGFSGIAILILVLGSLVGLIRAVL